MNKKTIDTSKTFAVNPLVNDSIEKPFAKDYSGKLENFARNLTAFIEGKTKNRPLVISLSAPYGMGKTTFIDMWGQWLANERKIAIKYDAWQEDYCENALLSILATINEQLGLFVKSTEILTTIKNAGFELGIKCLPAIIKFIISAGAEFIGISESLREFMNDLPSSKGVKELADKFEEKEKKELTDFIIKEIHSHESKKKTISDFKSAMKDIFTDGQHKTLFFFVDELDRCKPIFALSILEAIKHFFDVENVCFILVSNQKVLFDIFRKTYGHSFESEDYFERFIDRHIALPTPDLDRFADRQIEQLPAMRDCNDKNKLFRHVLYGCCKTFGFSLREISKYLDDVTDFIITNDSSGKDIPDVYLPAVAYLLALKRRKSLAYNEIIRTRSIPKDLEISTARKFKIWPIEYLDESEREIFHWILNFLLASNDNKTLSILAHALTEKIVDIQNGGLSKKLPADCVALIALEHTLINIIYDGLTRPAILGKDTYEYNGESRVYVKKYINHLGLSMQIIDFLTPIDTDDVDSNEELPNFN